MAERRNLFALTVITDTEMPRSFPVGEVEAVFDEKLLENHIKKHGAGQVMDRLIFALGRIRKINSQLKADGERLLGTESVLSPGPSETDTLPEIEYHL